jgi:flagellar motility protein MotE (MotC chaperone)
MDAYFHIVIPLAAILVAASVLLLMLARYRRQIREDSPTVSTSTSLTLPDLRRLRESGQISPEEFERARQKIVSNAQRDLQHFQSPDLARERRVAENTERLVERPKLDPPLEP